jgi:hypothetical protein
MLHRHSACLSAAVVLSALVTACHAPRSKAARSAAATPASTAVVAPQLVTAPGWSATIALDLGSTGIWTTKVLDVFERYGGQEVVALDDTGKCHVLVQYAGKWTDHLAAHDTTWFGGLTHGDVDGRKPGRELYVGAASGRVWQITPQPEGVLDANVIAELEGAEVHTVVALEGELLAFTSPGALWRLRAPSEGTRFEARKVAATGGRVRDAVKLAGGELALVSREGTLEVRRPDALEQPGEVVLRVEGGLGRVAASAGGVLYAVSDDGVVWRCERVNARWRTERIYAGPQGLRGIVTGRFSAPASSEELALFGYSGDVLLLSRLESGAWSAETIFSDRDKGHWLGVGELDQRNATDELVGSGYGGRVFVLAREPGYGLDSAARTGR